MPKMSTVGLEPAVALSGELGTLEQHHWSTHPPPLSPPRSNHKKGKRYFNLDVCVLYRINRCDAILPSTPTHSTHPPPLRATPAAAAVHEDRRTAGSQASTSEYWKLPAVWKGPQLTPELPQRGPGARPDALPFVLPFAEPMTTPVLRRLNSPGILLRLESETTPCPHPVPELTRPSCAPDALPMHALIAGVAWRSRGGRDPARNKKTNQDSAFAFRQYLGPSRALFGVLDGHGAAGHRISQLAKQHLPVALAAELRGDAIEEEEEAMTSGDDEVSEARKSGSEGAESEVGSAPCAREALESAFLSTHAALRCAVQEEAQFSGTTAVVTLLQGRRLTTAWVGDSRAVLVRRSVDGHGWECTPLTTDHKPGDEQELARILAAGGRVRRVRDNRGHDVGPLRVWLPTAWTPGLAMSRSLGDLAAHGVGVSARAQTTVVELGCEDEFLVLASDGVWEFIQPEEAARAVGRCETAEEASAVLVEAAYDRWMAYGEGTVDDITAVVVKFREALWD
jgi:serine/threonine protein phosphatase PrpC